MNDEHQVSSRFSYLGPDLIKQMLDVSEIRSFPPQTELVREGQYVKVIPIVLSGLVKVFTHSEDKELLLYYIKPEQSCIMSFSSALHNESSKVDAITEQTSVVLLLPSDKVSKWITEYPAINTLFYQQYDLRYAELINSIRHLIYDKLDRRILDYLNEMVQMTGQNPLKITHKTIAADLGTAREVVSRLIKKLEGEHLLKQYRDSIELL